MNKQLNFNILNIIMIKKQSQDLDQILELISDTNVRRLIKTQIQELKDFESAKVTSNNGRIFIRLEFPQSNFTFTLPESPVHFLIKIKKGFPLAAPRVYMQTSICNPTTNDARDYFRDIVGKQWNYSIQFKEIQQKIPQFVTNIFLNKKDGLLLQKMGYFHLGEYFSYKLLKTCKGIEMFLSFWEVDEKVVMDYIAVSDSHIIVLRPQLQPVLEDNKLHVPQQQKIDNLRLMSYADIQSICEIRISREENSQVEIILKSQKLKKMAAEITNIKLHYRVVKLKQMLKKLLKNIPKFQHVEMTYQTTKKDDFLQMQNGIRIAENNLKKYFNKDNINLLNSYYQNAVEYLSGIGNPAYLVYLNKITQLSLREDVKLVTSTQK